MSRGWPTSNHLLAGLLCGAAMCSNAFSAETIFEFTGSTSRNTPEFEVRAPWVLEWRTSSDGNPQMAVDIALHRAGTGVYEGRVLTTKFPGNGVKLFDQDGEFYFRVDSSFATWRLKVLELSQEEAAQYTPRATED